MSATYEPFLLAGGLFHLACAAFHLLFWKLFGWDRDLSSLKWVNRSVMQILNLCLIFVFLLFAYLSLVHRDDLLSPGIGTALLVSITTFWLFRAIQQVVFFRLKNRVSVAFFIAFLLAAALYGVPVLAGHLP